MTHPRLKYILNRHTPGNELATKTQAYRIVDALLDEGTVGDKQAKRMKSQIRRTLRPKRSKKSKAADSVVAYCSICSMKTDNYEVDLVILEGQPLHVCRDCIQEITDGGKKFLPNAEAIRIQVSDPSRHEPRRRHATQTTNS